MLREAYGNDTSSKEQTTIKIFWKCHYRWRDVGLRLWQWNQTRILTLEESCFALPQESTIGALTKTILLVFIKALCIMNSFLKVKQLRFLSGSSEMSAGCGTKKVTWNVDCRKLAPPSL
jgi:hypothetical protein